MLVRPASVSLALCTASLSLAPALSAAPQPQQAFIFDGAIEPQSTWALAFTPAGIQADRAPLLPPDSAPLPLLQLSPPGAPICRPSVRLLGMPGEIDARAFPGFSPPVIGDPGDDCAAAANPLGVAADVSAIKMFTASLASDLNACADEVDAVAAALKAADLAALSSGVTVVSNSPPVCPLVIDAYSEPLFQPLECHLCEGTLRTANGAIDNLTLRIASCRAMRDRLQQALVLANRTGLFDQDCMTALIAGGYARSRLDRATGKLWSDVVATLDSSCSPETVQASCKECGSLSSGGSSSAPAAFSVPATLEVVSIEASAAPLREAASFIVASVASGATPPLGAKALAKRLLAVPDERAVHAIVRGPAAISDQLIALRSPLLKDDGSPLAVALTVLARDADVAVQSDPKAIEAWSAALQAFRSAVAPLSHKDVDEDD